jgi:hypothetical protein
MREAFSLLLFLLTGHLAIFGQVVDRYPYIQQPTQNGALIAWNTAQADVGTLTWGNSPSNLNNTLSDPNAIEKHHFSLSNLQPNTQYFYQVTNPNGFTSAVEHFWTAKTPTQNSVSFLHYGDCGYDNAIQNQIAGLMEQEDVDFAVVAGDVDQGVGTNYDNVFFGVYQNMLARDCHFTAIGNHDIISNGGIDFFDAFFQPTNNPQGVENYYTFTWGNAKFICLDSNGDYSPGSDQHNFLLDEMRCNEHQWLFVFFHHPPWTNAWDPLYYVPFQEWHNYDGEDDMRTDLVPYFEQYGVDFVLNGHSHCYQRGNMNGVEYVISGGAGSAITDDVTCNTFPSYNSCSPNIQLELLINQYVRFEIKGDTVSYVCIDENGQVVDSISKTKTFTSYQSSLSSNPESSSGALDGTATATVTGPHPPYSFLWSSGDVTATANGLATGTYTVDITDAYGCVRTDTVMVGLATSVEALETFELQVFPNPFNDAARFSFSNPGRSPLKLEIFNASGQQLRQIEGIHSESIVINRNGLPSGIYFYRLSGAIGSEFGKLVVK